MRPIDGDALKMVLSQSFNDPELVIDDAPTLDLAPIKQADWLEHGCSTFCTRCGEKPLYDYFGKLKLSNYCPNCGAKMDGGKKDGCL